MEHDHFNRVTNYYYQGAPFTGCAKQILPQFGKYYFYQVKNGRLERQVGFYDNGQKCRDYTFINGFTHGVIELFYDDGSPYIREEYSNGKLHGSLKRWKDGQLVREAEFWNGSMVWEKIYEIDMKNSTARTKKKDGC